MHAHTGCVSPRHARADRFGAKKEAVKRFYGLVTESQGHNLTLDVPYSLDSGRKGCGAAEIMET